MPTLLVLILQFISTKYIIGGIDKGIKKTLVMREVPEDGVKALLSNKESLAACDIAIFVHDRYQWIS